MTLATDLTLLANTKTAIKAAIENKGVTVGAIPFNQYPAKIDSIPSDDEGWTQQKYDAVLAAVPMWNRPDWKTIPAVGLTEQKVVGLYPVFEYGDSFCSLVASGDYTVDWGDGVVENFAAGVQADHIFNYANPALGAVCASEGYKQVIVTVTPQAGQNLTAINLGVKHPNFLVNASRCIELSLGSPHFSSIVLANTGLASSIKRIRLASVGTITNFSNFFINHTALTHVEITGDTSAVTNTSFMFNNCTSLTTISLFNTSAVTNMSNMFNNSASLTTVPLFNTAAVRDMSNMFRSCRELTIVPLFNTAAVTDMNNMFFFSYRLTAVPLFNTASVTNMSTMLGSCGSLTKVPFFDTSKATDMSNMLASSPLLTSIPPFNTASVTNMSAMLSSCTKLTTIPFFDTSKVTNMQSMLASCGRLTTIPFFDTSEVTNMQGMLTGCISLTTIPFFNTSKVTNMNRMFNRCFSLTTVPLFNTAAVRDMNSMFIDCTRLTTVPLFNTAAVTDMNNMFSGCVFLNSIPAMVFVWATASANITNCGSLGRITAQFKANNVVVSVLNCNLSATALNEFFTSQSATVGGKITITGNPGAATCDRTIATAKGWTVTG